MSWTIWCRLKARVGQMTAGPAQQTQDVESILVYRWYNELEQTLNQHWFNVLCLLGDRPEFPACPGHPRLTRPAWPAVQLLYNIWGQRRGDQRSSWHPVSPGRPSVSSAKSTSAPDQITSKSSPNLVVRWAAFFIDKGWLCRGGWSPSCLSYEQHYGLRTLLYWRRESTACR